MKTNWLLSLAISLCAIFMNAQQAQNCSLFDITSLPHGTVINNLFLGNGVTIQAIPNPGGTNEAMIYDSDGAWVEDPDLNVGIGNLIIINEDPLRNDGDPKGPDDNETGGILKFFFNDPVTIESLVVVDADKPGFVCVAYDASNTLLGSVPIPKGVDGGVQTVPIGLSNIKRFEITFPNSGGFQLNMDCPCGMDLRGLPHGTKVNNFFPGVTITSIPAPGGTTDAVIYNSDGNWVEDPDLNGKVGNLIIINENPNRNDGDNRGPDDNEKGGTLRFDFATPIDVVSLLAVDVEKSGQFVDVYNAASVLVKTVMIPKMTNGSVQTVALNVPKASRVDIRLTNSGGFRLNFNCPPPCSSFEMANLQHGTVINNLFVADGVTIQAIPNPGGTTDAMIYNSNGSWVEDPDLNASIGNLIIINEDPLRTDGDTGGPDDNETGGILKFFFNDPVTIVSVVAVDVDKAGTYMVTYDALNNVIANVPAVVGPDGNVQTVVMNSPGTHRLEIVCNNSGGFVPIMNCPGALQIQKSALQLAAAVAVTEAVVEAYPNPFADAANLSFTLPAASQVVADVVAIDGRTVSRLFDGTAEANTPYDFRLAAEGLPNGVYFFRVMSNGSRPLVTKLVLNR